MEVLWSAFWILVAFLFYIFLQWRIKTKERNGDYYRISSYLPQLFFYPQPDQNTVYNISGRVQGQQQPPYPDAYLSIDHITITNELNKPPPSYDNAAPPSYEEAMKLATAQSISIQTFQEEQARVHRQQPQQQQPHSSTSNAAAQNVTVTVPAAPNQTTE